MRTSITVESDTRDMLKRLQGVLSVSNYNDLILQLLARLGYNEYFFSRLDTLQMIQGEKTE